jgi:Ca-activated chloride channel family protein
MFTLRLPPWVSFLALLGVGFHSAAVAQVSQAISVPVLRPLVQVRQAEQPVRLSKAEVRVQVSGGLAVTRVHLSLHNPNRRDLEGELQFPLRDGQTVTGFALESLDGQMMPAVAVAKARGQEVFEAIVRRGADPALLEQTQGNNYKLRVYPLPAGKARRVMLEISELLKVDAAGRYRYRIPEALAQAEELSLSIQVHGLAANKLRVPAVLRGAEVLNRHGDAWVLLERARPLDAGKTASESLQWPAPEQATVFSDRFEGASYFHADIPLPKGLSEPRPTRLLHRLALVWDASGSGAARDHDREFALLTALFNDLRDSGAMKVTLVVARDQAEAPREFEILGGDWSALRAALRALVYDGASNPAAWAPPAGHDLALLFSDGLGNWGGAATPPSTVPMYTLSASSSAHAERLRAIAEASPGAGRYLDLLRMDTASALAELLTLQPRLVTEDGDGVADVVFPSAYPQDGVLRLAGRLTRPQATLHYALHWPDGRVQKLALNITTEPEATALISTLAARRWAGYRIAALEADPALHQADIERLGKQFGLVTSRTSLLALESLADYQRYEILPPPGPWREAYLQRQSERQQKRHAQQSQHLDDLAHRYAGLADWWSRDYPKNAPTELITPVHEQGRPGIEARTEGVDEARAGMPIEDVHARQNAGVQQSMTLSASPRPATAGVRVPDGVRWGYAAAPMVGARAPAPDLVAVSASAPATIHLQPWQPDAPYARRLREARMTDATRSIWMNGPVI